MNETAHPDRAGARISEAVRFWIYSGRHPVKIALRPEDSISVRWSERHDEGFSYRDVRYTHCGDRIDCLYREGGVDCDGRIDYVTELEVGIEALRTLDIESMAMPVWELSSETVRDHSAEAANY